MIKNELPLHLAEKKAKTKKIRRILLGIALVLIIIIVAGFTVLSYSPAKAATFTDTVLRPLIGDKAVIILEDHVFALKDRIKRLQGNPPDSSSYSVAVATTIVPNPTPSSAQATAEPNPAPPNLIPYIDQAHPLKNEGKWEAITGAPFYTTFIRTDSERPFSVVNLVYMPMQHLGIDAVAGTKHPGGAAGLPGPGKIPQAIQDSGNLLAAFNGGFQEKDGHYGMVADGTTYVPLRTGLSTFYIYKNGQIDLTTYDGKPLPDTVTVARQNGPPLITDGKDNQLTSQGINLWAGTASGGYITWRSGLGITSNHDLIYAVGPSLTPTSLADALRLAGSSNAMQLDINDFWVRFMLYSPKPPSYTWTPLVKGLADGGSAYLHGYEKDFFYVYKK